MNEVKKIHESLVNGNREQMARRIDEYGTLFWEDYRFWIDNLVVFSSNKFKWFSDAVVSYHRIKEGR